MTTPPSDASAALELAPWAGLLADTSVAAGRRTPTEALRAYAERPAPHVGGLVVRDTDLPMVLAELAGLPDREEALGIAPPLVVRLTGGAGQLAGPASLCARHGVVPARLEVALRDLEDLPGNARRVVAAVDAARAEGALGDDVLVAVGLPGTGAPGGPGWGWSAAADELAMAELALALPTAGSATTPPPDPRTTVAWLDAALDRELPLTCAATSAADAAALLLATRLLLDGEPADDVARLLTGSEATRLRARLDEAGGEALTRARRWLLAVGADDPDDVAEGLQSLLGARP